MKVSGFHEAVSAIVAENPQFHPEGYHFLRDSLESALKKRSKAKQSPASPHISSAELLESFRKLALKEFGPMAPTVLEYWGVRSCRDIGRMVFYLVEAGVLGRTEEDTIEGFDRGFDFHEAFVRPFLPPGSAERTAAPMSPTSLLSE